MPFQLRQHAGLAVLLFAVVVGWGMRGDAPATPGPLPVSHGPYELTQDEVDAGFTYGPGIDATNRPAIDQAVATARPEAQALIARIDGLTLLRAGTPQAGAAGTTQPLPTGQYDVVLDTGGVYRRLGQRGINRLVLHELGHVIDHALLPTDLRARLDAAIPPGLPCRPGTPTGSCAPVAERFAETFAKWAMRDVGYDLWIGYAVPAPADLEAWAGPLAELDG